MNALLLLGLLAQAFAVCGFMYRGQISEQVYMNEQCASLCDYYNNICLPSWVDPNNQFYQHCEGDNNVKQASVRCVLCLKTNEVLPEQDQPTTIFPVNKAKIMPQNTSNVTPDPCRSTCKGYKGMCMPKKLDPDGNFQPQCTGVNDSRHPSSWCFYCLVKHGHPSKAISKWKLDTANTTAYGVTVVQTITEPSPTSDRWTATTQWITTTVNEIIDLCAPKCNHYNDVCLPKWVDPKNLLLLHCEDQKELKEASIGCLICFKNKTVQLKGKSDVPTTTAQTLTTTKDNLVYFCAPLCNYFNDICLPKWIDPNNLFRTQCEENSQVKRATVPCVLCLTHKEMPPTDSIDISQSLCLDCADPCERLCDGYKGMCMPTKLDPQGYFQPHCNGLNDQEHPPSLCFYCLAKHGLPDSLANLPKTAFVNKTENFIATVQTTIMPTLESSVQFHAIPTETTTTNNANDICASICNHYDNICLPKWVDPGNNFHSHCEDNKNMTRAAGRCLICLKQNGLPTTKPTTIETTTTPIPLAPAEGIFEFCAILCNFYDNVCLPRWADPENLFHIHCEDNDQVIRAPLPCVLCLKQHEVPQLDLVDASPTPCWDCVDPCESVCYGYRDMCMPAPLDIQGHFQPHCITPNDYGQPSAWCFYCLVKHGLPERFMKMSTPPMTFTPEFSSTYIQTTTHAPPTTQTTIKSTLTTTTTTDLIDFCSPLCNNYRDTCLPQWADPKNHFRTHCKDITDPQRAAVHCLACLKPIRMLPAYTQAPTTPIRLAPTMGLNEECAQLCNNYTNICLPLWVDPDNHFPVHCINKTDRKRPPMPCLMCLKNHGLLQNGAISHLSHQRFTTTTTTEPIMTIVTFCAPLCNNFDNICLPKWADPEIQLPYHCEANRHVKHASVPCVLCVKQNEVPPKESSAIHIPPCTDCTDPCESICNFYIDMCIPAKQDPEGRFQPHCRSEIDNAPPTSWCFYCLVKHGLPKRLTGTLPPVVLPPIDHSMTDYQTTTYLPLITNIQTSTPTQVKIAEDLIDECASLCGLYHNICLPKWVDPQDHFHTHCEDSKDVKRAPVRCLVCLKQKRVPPIEKTTMETTTKPMPTTNPAGIFEFCAPLCNNYNDICMPRSADPENHFNIHCEANGKMKRPAVPCVLCLQQYGAPPSDFVLPTFCSNCVDPCELVCNSYRDMCVPSKLDPEGHIQPHCRNSMADLYPSAWCFYCLVKHGLPERITNVPTDLQGQTQNVMTQTTTDDMIDACAPLCNYYHDICLPKWLDLENQFHTHCEDSKEVNRPPAPCLACIKERRIPSHDYADFQTATTPIFSTTKMDSAELCAAVCNYYQNICLPMWLDPYNLFHTHCKDSNDPKRASVRCVICIKENRPPLNILATPTLTTSTITTITTTATNLEITNFCAPLCSNFNDICVPTWVDPRNILRSPCETNPTKKLASVPCVLCLQQEVLPPANAIDTSQSICLDCTEPCEHVCHNYRDMCIPARLDRAGLYVPHCAGTDDLLPSFWCFYCLVRHGLPERLARKPTTVIESMNEHFVTRTTAMPMVTTASHDEDVCALLCNYYQDICLPKWVDPENLFHTHCEDSKNVKSASISCLVCLKKKRKKSIVGNDFQSTATTVSQTFAAMKIEFCAPLCNYYNDICLPRWMDPENNLYNYCDASNIEKRASVTCVLCLKQNTLPSTDSAEVAPSPCLDCDDRCVNICNRYRNMCTMAHVDPIGYFPPHCPSVNDVRLPSFWCFDCLVKHGVPDRFAGTTPKPIERPNQLTTPYYQITTYLQPTVNIETATPLMDATSEEDMFDTCAPFCNYFHDICLPKWVDPENQFHTHCEDNRNAKKPSVRCLICVKQKIEPTTKDIDDEYTTTPSYPTDSKHTLIELCAPKCEYYNEICIPAWADPNKIFKNHCEIKSDVKQAPVQCLVCLKQGGSFTTIFIPQFTTKERTTPQQLTTESTTMQTFGTTTMKAYHGFHVDKCRPICNYYVDICLPGWLDPWDFFSPHCEDVHNVGRPDVSCLLCLKSHCVTPTPPQSTQPYFTTAPKPSARFGTVQPFPPTERTAISKGPLQRPNARARAPEGCPGICSCTRLQTVTTEVTTSFCPVAHFDDYECDLTDPSAVTKSTDESNCSCVKDDTCKAGN